MGFGVISVMLALILGILSWKHIFGKVVTIAVPVLFVLTGLQWANYSNDREHVEAEMQQTFDTERLKAEPVNRQTATRPGSESGGVLLSVKTLGIQRAG
jgi:3'-phosphoadenosine 5'-phosphosulfate sulfotransferase (PAPS reductase)/FAD synthetase